MAKSRFLTFSKSADDYKKSRARAADSHENPFAMSEGELFSQLPRAPGPTLFLDRFTAADMTKRLEDTGFWAAMIQKGVRRPRLALERVEPDEHRLLILDEEAPAPLRMMELRLTLTRLEIPTATGAAMAGESYEMLAINWAMLQNPRINFTKEHPQFPGQEHPGLGLGRKCQEFLVTLARELRRDGLINYPQFFHNAVIYRDEYSIVDPIRQGELLAMIRDLSKRPLHLASHAIAAGKLMDKVDHRAVEWKPDAMICPIRRRLKKYFETSAYRKAVESSAASHAYDLAL